MEFVNLTPHPITIEGLGTLPSQGVARCATMRNEAAPVGGVRLAHLTFGEVQGLPAPREGVTFVVSSLVLSALGGARGDVVAPDTGADAIRENGQIVAVRGFVQWAG